MSTFRFHLNHMYYLRSKIEMSYLYLCMELMVYISGQMQTRLVLVSDDKLNPCIFHDETLY